MIDIILNLANDETIQQWIISGIAFILGLIFFRIFKKKIDAKKLEPIIAKIIEWILDRASNDEPSIISKSAVDAKINALPKAEKALVNKYLGSDPTQTVYDKITEPIPKGKKSNVLTTLAKTAGNAGISLLVTGLSKKLF